MSQKLPKILNAKGTYVPAVPIDTSKVESRYIDINDFFAIRKNPKQRHTLTQAKKNKKLRKFVQMHATDIQPHPEIFVVPEEITEALPLNLGIRGTEIRETHLDERTLCVEVIHDPAECP